MTTKRPPPGSALLIALMLMSILMMLGLGVSNLVISQIKEGRLLIEKTKAWYAAEAGLEHAMLAVSSNPPGFEAKEKKELADTGVGYEYQIRATASRIPAKESADVELEEETYNILHHNETITIPLFRGTAEGDGVKKFHADYYFAPELKLASGFLPDDLDILRWKIFGIAKDGAMEVMSEFVPANKDSSAVAPTCIGTEEKLSKALQCYVFATFYVRQLGASGSPELHKSETYPIAKFLAEHRQNFLVLTNISNVDLIATKIGLTSDEKKKIANIYYRVVEGENEPRLTLPYIEISVDGQAGETQQSLDIQVARDRVLPVFNYALYRTKE